MAFKGALASGPIDEANALSDGAAAYTSDGAGQVGGAAAVLDMGTDGPKAPGGPPYSEGHIVLNVSAMSVAGGDESYTLRLQGSDTADFAAFYELSAWTLGDAAATGNDGDLATGGYRFPACNQIGEQSFRYLRLYVDVAGAAPSVTFKAWLVD